VIQHWWWESFTDEPEQAIDSSGCTVTMNRAISVLILQKLWQCGVLFLASVTTYSSSGGPRSNTSTTTEWTMENVGTWLDEAMAIAFRHDDLAVGARAFCLEWSHVGAFFPRRLHQCTIQLMDKKM
jgi:hypothetical protein